MRIRRGPRKHIQRVAKTGPKSLIARVHETDWLPGWDRIVLPH